MSVAFKIGGVVTEIGSPDLVHAFFSTISYHLEPGGWGTKYPVLLKELYHTSLPAKKATSALQEVREVREKLKAYAPEQVIWDIENLKARPPWGSDISKDIKDLSEYFLTNAGQNFFDVIIENLEFLQGTNEVMSIRPTWEF